METLANAPLHQTQSDDLVQAAHQQIQTALRAKITHQNLPDLIAELLAAENYACLHREPQADGATELLVAAGTFGWDDPRYVVRMYGPELTVGNTEMDRMEHTMRDHKAFHGILVSWDGFGDGFLDWSADKRFNVRIWSAEEVLRQVYRHYDKLSAEWKARLPLRRTWTLVEK